MPGMRTMIAAWVIIVSHGLGVFANGYSLVVGNPTYSRSLWAGFMILKLSGLVAGVLLLKRMRAGVYLFIASLIAGLIVALTLTGPYRIWEWLGAACVLGIVVAGFLYVVRSDWSQLRQRDSKANDEPFESK